MNTTTRVALIGAISAVMAAIITAWASIQAERSASDASESATRAATRAETAVVASHEAVRANLAAAVRGIVGDYFFPGNSSAEMRSSVKSAILALAKAPPGEEENANVLREVRTAIYYCIQGGRDDEELMVELQSIPVSRSKLVGSYKDFSWGETTFIHEAATTGSIKCLKHLVENAGWNKNLIAPMGSSKTERTPLQHMQAIWSEREPNRFQPESGFTNLEGHRKIIQECFLYLQRARG